MRICAGAGNHLFALDRRVLIKHIATVARKLNLGVAGIYAQQTPVTITFSGTVARSVLNLNQRNTTVAGF